MTEHLNRILLYFGAGACSCSALIFLFVWIRQRSNHVYLFYGLFCLCIGFVNFYLALTYDTFDVDRWVFYSKNLFLWAILSTVAYSWFVCAYTQRYSKPFLIVSNTAMLVFLVMNFTTEYTLMIGELHGLEYITLPWGEQVVSYVGVRQSAGYVFLLSSLCIRMYALYAGWMQYRRGERERAIVILAYWAFDFFCQAVTILLLVMQIRFIILYQYSVIAGVILLSLYFADELYRQTRALMIANKRIKEGEHRLRSIFNGVNDAIILNDPRTLQIIQVNRCMCEMFGYTAEQALQLKIEDLGLAAIMPRADMVENSSDSTEFSNNSFLEWRARGGNGETFWVEVNMRAFRQDGRKLLLSVVRNIDERKRLEGSLRQAQKMEAIGRLAGGIAHDFNNLLQVINGYAEMARADCLRNATASASASVDEILKAGERATTLVSQLLAFSRRQVAMPEVFNLNDIIDEMMSMLHRVIGEHIGIELEKAPNLPNIRADRGMIDQILMNLCINARDAMPDGGRLVIKTEIGDITPEFCSRNDWARPGSFVVLRISDNGAGMDSETLAQIFEPFFTTKTTGKGTGLGLATVFGIVESHQGFIHVHSELDFGSTFCIYLPISTQAATQPVSADRRNVQCGGELLLLAEDDPMVRDLSVGILTGAGYKVLAARDGLEALDLFRRHRGEIAMAILDMVMPGMNGPEVVKKIRAAQPDLPIIAVSGYSASLATSDFISQHKISFIQKPYKSRVLLEKVMLELAGNTPW